MMKKSIVALVEIVLYFAIMKHFNLLSEWTIAIGVGIALVLMIVSYLDDLIYKLDDIETRLMCIEVRINELSENYQQNNVCED